MKPFNTLKKASLGLTSFAISAATFAANTTPCGSGTGQGDCNISGISEKIHGAYRSGVNIFYAAAAVIGVGFIVGGLFKAKAHSHDMQGTSGHMKGAVTMLIVGAMLVSIPLIMITIRSTAFGTSGGLNLPSENEALS